jgi:hypothetical protein
MTTEIIPYAGLPDVFANDPLIDFQQYRSLLCYPTWNYFSETIRLSREYDLGLAVAIHLLNLTERYRAQLDDKQYLQNTEMSYYMILHMLDKLDRWEDFLNVFAGVMKDVRFTHRCHKKYLEGEFGDAMARYSVPETPCYVRLHSFWPQGLRKEVMERKIERRRKGMKMGNMLHPQKDALSPSEVNERRERILRMFAELRRTGSQTQPEKPPDYGPGLWIHVNGKGQPST